MLMNFSVILCKLKLGYKARRRGWNGKGLFIHLVANDPKLEPYFVIYNENTGLSNTWVPSVSDLLAEDWEVVESKVNIKQRVEELHDLSLPLVKYVREHYHPHTKIIITDTGVELLTVEMGCPVPVDVKIPVKEDK